MSEAEFKKIPTPIFNGIFAQKEVKVKVRRQQKVYPKPPCECFGQAQHYLECKSGLSYVPLDQRMDDILHRIRAKEEILT